MTSLSQIILRHSVLVRQPNPHDFSKKIVRCGVFCLALFMPVTTCNADSKEKVLHQPALERDIQKIRDRRFLIHSYLLQIYLHKSRHEEAVKEFNSLLALEPQNKTLRIQFGSYLAAHGDRNYLNYLDTTSEPEKIYMDPSISPEDQIIRRELRRRVP